MHSDTVMSYSEQYEAIHGETPPGISSSDKNCDIYSLPGFALVPYKNLGPRIVLTHWANADIMPVGQNIRDAVLGDLRATSLDDVRQTCGADSEIRVTPIKFNESVFKKYRNEPWMTPKGQQLIIRWVYTPPPIPVADCFDDVRATPGAMAVSAQDARQISGKPVKRGTITLPAFKTMRTIKRHYGDYMDAPYFHLTQHDGVFTPTMSVFHTHSKDHVSDDIPHTLSDTLSTPHKITFAHMDAM